MIRGYLQVPRPYDDGDKHVDDEDDTVTVGVSLSRRMDLLDSIKFVWKIHKYFPWIEMYQQLVVYKKQHKTPIPECYKEDPKNGSKISEYFTRTKYFL